MPQNTRPASNRPRTVRNALRSVAWVPAVLVAGLVAWPLITVWAQVLHTGKGPSLESGVDPAIRPGDDFFAYANGQWLKANPIPPGKLRWGARDQIDMLTRQRVARLLDDARSAPAGSDARKVADFRTAYLNASAIESRGIAPLKPLFDSIDLVQDKSALTRWLGARMRADVDPLNVGVYTSSTILGLSVEPSIHGEKGYVAFLLQGGLGLPDRDDYLGTDPKMQAQRTRYQEYIGQLLAMAGFDRANQRAESVLALETAIARTQATREATEVDRNADNRWSRTDFVTDAPGMDWGVFFAAAGLGKQDSFVAWQPSAVKGVASLVASEPVQAWQDYLRFHAIDHYADLLSPGFADKALAMHSAAAGVLALSREQRATDATQLAMGEAIGRMYTDAYLPPKQRAHIQQIVANVKAAFIRRLDSVEWMSPNSRELAAAKVKKLYVGIGYPDHWQDWSDLTIDPSDPLGNARRVEDRNLRHAVAAIGQPVDNTNWAILPQSVSAVLIFQQNCYDFSAALLQTPKWDPAAPEAAMYGAIGAIVGHDVTHFVDVLGADYVLDGGMHHWWTTADSLRFQAAAQPLVTQFSGYRPFPDAHVNGKLTETENVADLGGLVSAFDAYRASLGSRRADKAYVHQQDREFFLGFAQSWREQLSDTAMRTQLANDHAPLMYRVSTVRNLDAWYDAFDVKPGQKLYVEPKARVKVW